MAERLEVYKCDLCGNIIEVLHGGAGELVCCGQPMNLLAENTVDAAKEKHVPVVEKTEWIEIIADGKSYRQFLNPGETPEATFKVDAEDVTAREYCNLHGHWKA